MEANLPSWGVFVIVGVAAVVALGIVTVWHLRGENRDRARRINERYRAPEQIEPIDLSDLTAFEHVLLWLLATWPGRAVILLAVLVGAWGLLG